MKARLVPIYFPHGRDQDFDIQLANLHEMLASDGEIVDFGGGTDRICAVS